MNEVSNVRIVGVNIGFGDLMSLIFKATLASIPAMIVVTIVLGAITLVMGVVLSALGMAFGG